MPEWLQIILRSVGFLVLLILLTRLLGRKIASRMTYFDIVFAVSLGVIAAAVSLNIVENAVFGFIALLTWGLAGMGLSYLSLKSKWVRDLIHGREAVVIKHGKVMEDQLKKMRYTPEDLLQQLRSKQIFNLADVEFAVMESNGEINALLKANRLPITPRDVGVETTPQTGIQTVILDGNIMDESLNALGLNRRWLRTELDKIGISAENVFVAQVDTMGELYVDLFDDAIQPPVPTTRRLLYNTLETAKADLKAFALDTDDQKAKQMYEQCVKELDSIIYDVRPMLK
ncbi:DUF421 domain-containing protein [Paenactinomyces guangxiensis]|uniref:DUF421 domain-containing protein n=1 Tax=Paenactinomyces guangxiensis TaxID=1490290 RepID=A0A7W1WRY6_9BACL|nr:DUF421 domain-containing protein [Paenactinomyces guangxiensis]MBA4494967.1 DUF421 domain-containing protein [Paenactinomyces guangxiensis]MBH8592050.1 DUF421 domain-containing protein [Paenactinomyces guangxiensis]